MAQVMRWFLHSCIEDAPLSKLVTLPQALLLLAYWMLCAVIHICKIVGKCLPGSEVYSVTILIKTCRDRGTWVSVCICTQNEQIHFTSIVNMRPRPRVCVTACEVHIMSGWLQNNFTGNTYATSIEQSCLVFYTLYIELCIKYTSAKANIFRIVKASESSGTINAYVPRLRWRDKGDLRWHGCVRS